MSKIDSARSSSKTAGLEEQRSELARNPVEDESAAPDRAEHFGPHRRAISDRTARRSLSSSSVHRHCTRVCLVRNKCMHNKTPRSAETTGKVRPEKNLIKTHLLRRDRSPGPPVRCVNSALFTTPTFSGADRGAPVFRARTQAARRAAASACFPTGWSSPRAFSRRRGVR